MLDSFFARVPKWDMDEARRYMREHRLDDYTLLDVRQPDEYADGHLPGATLIPLDQLPNRLSEIDRAKPTLVYCRSGGRAGNATALLTRSGFEQAQNIGGIMQWNGLVASGPPEAGMAVFDAARSSAEHVALARELEEGARRFYQQMAPRFPELQKMLEAMAAGEERHRDLLDRLYHDLGRQGEPSFVGVEGMMEGGIELREALAWAKESEAVDVLEFAAAMEANAHDRYILVGRKVGGATERAFIELAEAEKVHMDQLMRAFQERLR